MRGLVICTALLVMPACASANVKVDIARIEAAQEKCVKADDSTSGMKQCVWAAYQDADKLLNQVYQRLSRSWTGEEFGAPERRKRLVAAQRAWIAFRDAECELQATQMLGGSGEGLVEGGCLFKMTADRARQIEELLEAN